ncbi:MAG: hypothetical protein AAGJ38_07455 [Planctomycetota bacterium]
MMTPVTLQPALPRSESVDRFAWHPNCWCYRGVATTLALAVSGMYGLFLTQTLGILGAGVLLGAAIAWPIFLALVWFSTPPALRFARLDWGLWAMTVGSVVMAMGLLATLIGSIAGWPPLATLLSGLLVADVAMGWVLTRYAPGVAVSRRAALLMWVGGMNLFLLAFVGFAAMAPSVTYFLVVGAINLAHLLLLIIAFFAPVALVLALAIYLGREPEPAKKETL